MAFGFVIELNVEGMAGLTPRRDIKKKASKQENLTGKTQRHLEKRICILVFRIKQGSQIRNQVSWFTKFHYSSRLFSPEENPSFPPLRAPT